MEVRLVGAGSTSQNPASAAIGPGENKRNRCNLVRPASCGLGLRLKLPRSSIWILLHCLGKECWSVGGITIRAASAARLALGALPARTTQLVFSTSRYELQLPRRWPS